MVKNIIKAGSLAAVAALLVAPSAFAASTVVVTPTDTKGWAQDDTRIGGSTTFVSDSTSPWQDGALQLSTDDTNTAKADYWHSAEGTKLSEVTDLSYATKKLTASSVSGTASYQLAMDVDGDGTWDTNLVYEPYWQEGATVTEGQWQTWDVDSGLFWSSKTTSDGKLVGAAGGPATYSLADVKGLYNDAVVMAFGVNVGSYNPAYTINVDGVKFNDTTYDFEKTAKVEPPVVVTPTDKDQCKKDGYKKFKDASGKQMFKNQGQCVSSVAKTQNQHKKS